MSAAAAIPGRALGASWFKSPIDIEDWIRMGRRIWGWLKDRVRHRRKEHRVRDRDLARDLGCSRRSVQRGLLFLELMGVIVRRREHGEYSGRVIVIVMPLAGDNKDEDKAERKGSGRKAAARPAPTTAAAPAAPPEPPPSAEEQRQAVGGLRAMMAKILEEQRQSPPAEADPATPSPPPAAPRKLRGIPRDLNYVRLKVRMGEKLTADEQAMLDAADGNRSP